MNDSADKIQNTPPNFRLVPVRDIWYVKSVRGGGAVQRAGVDIESMILCQPDSGEMALEVVDQLVRSSAVDIIVVDSVAALVPRAEIEGEIGAVQGAPPPPATQEGSRHPTPARLPPVPSFPRSVACIVTGANIGML